MKRPLPLLFATLLLGSGAVLAQTTPAKLHVGVRDDAKLGAFITGFGGKTLYAYKKDTQGTTNCYATCAENWPPVIVENLPSVSLKIKGAFSLVERKDGAKQLAYNGLPLYYWKRDRKAGDTLGQGLNDLWSVVKP